MSLSLRKYEQDIIDEVVAQAKGEGLLVFLAERGTYGFITNDTGSSVVCFQVDLGIVSFSGNYISHNSGTGWQICKGMPSAGLADLLTHGAPQWATRGEAVKRTTLAHHLKIYQSSSRYTEVVK